MRQHLALENNFSAVEVDLYRLRWKKNRNREKKKDYQKRHCVSRDIDYYFEATYLVYCSVVFVVVPVVRGQ